MLHDDLKEWFAMLTKLGLSVLRARFPALDQDEQEDLVQQTIVKLLCCETSEQSGQGEHPMLLEAAQNPRGYFVCAVIHAAHDYLRHRNRAVNFDEGEDEGASHSSLVPASENEDLESDFAEKVLVAATMASRSERDQRIIVARAYGVESKEVADQMGTTPGNVDRVLYQFKQDARMVVLLARGDDPATGASEKPRRSFRTARLATVALWTGDRARVRCHPLARRPQGDTSYRELLRGKEAFETGLTWLDETAALSLVPILIEIPPARIERVLAEGPPSLGLTDTHLRDEMSAAICLGKGHRPAEMADIRSSDFETIERHMVPCGPLGRTMEELLLSRSDFVLSALAEAAFGSER